MNPSPLKISEACTHYLEGNGLKDKQLAQQELFRFARWCGWERVVSSIAPIEIEGYCSTLEGVGEDRVDRLNITKKFLTYLHKQGLTESNLAPHAKIRRNTRRAATGQRILRNSNATRLTAEGYKRLQSELTSLKSQRVQVAEDIRVAAAAKDVSENSPLDAAREQQGQLEARLRDIESILKGAVVIEESVGAGSAVAARVEVGSRIVLKEHETGREVSYMLVHSSEADPASRRISDASPVGRAVLDKAVGEKVDVITPRGTISYTVAEIT